MWFEVSRIYLSKPPEWGQLAPAPLTLEGTCPRTSLLGRDAARGQMPPPFGELRAAVMVHPPLIVPPPEGDCYKVMMNIDPVWVMALQQLTLVWTKTGALGTSPRPTHRLTLRCRTCEGFDKLHVLPIGEHFVSTRRMHLSYHTPTRCIKNHPQRVLNKTGLRYPTRKVALQLEVELNYITLGLFCQYF